MTRRPRDETAQIIWDDLAKHGESSTWAIRRRTGLTHMQYWYGLGYLKDVLQTANGQPLVYSPRRGVYSITANAADGEAYIEWRCRSMHTQLSRQEKNLEAQIAAYGTSK